MMMMMMISSARGLLGSAFSFSDSFLFSFFLGGDESLEALDSRDRSSNQLRQWGPVRLPRRRG